MGQEKCIDICSPLTRTEGADIQHREQLAGPKISQYYADNQGHYTVWAGVFRNSALAPKYGVYQLTIPDYNCYQSTSAQHRKQSVRRCLVASSPINRPLVSDIPLPLSIEQREYILKLESQNSKALFTPQCFHFLRHAPAPVFLTWPFCGTNEHPGEVRGTKKF